MIALICALTQKKHIIGLEGKIPWDAPADRARFRTLTMGGAIIFGRKTYLSIGHPLPGRLNIVLTKNPDNYSLDKSLKLCYDIPSALEYAKKSGVSNIFFCGGEKVYTKGFPYCDTLYLTIIRGLYRGDRFFPPLSLKSFILTKKESLPDLIFLTFKKICDK